MTFVKYLTKYYRLNMEFTIPNFTHLYQYMEIF